MAHLIHELSGEESLADKKTDKRAAIIEAARHLFTTQGYEATTIAQVARKAGVAVGTVYLYFKNKTELLLGVRDDFEILFVRAIQRADLGTIPPHLRIRALVTACCEIGQRYDEVIQLMGVQPQVIGEIPVKKGNLICQAIQQFIEEGQAAGVFRPINSQLTAIMSFAMVQEAMMEQCDDEIQQKAIIDTAVDGLERWVIKDEVLRQMYPDSR